MNEIVTGGDRLFDAHEDPHARRHLSINVPTVLGTTKWTSI